MAVSVQQGQRGLVKGDAWSVSTECRPAARLDHDVYSAWSGQCHGPLLHTAESVCRHGDVNWQATVVSAPIWSHNCLMAVCPGLPGWAGTRKNSLTLTPILIIRHPSSTSSIYCNPSHQSRDMYFSPGSRWSSSWSGTICFILNTFLYPVIIFLQHMLLPSPPVLLC